jgi:hypothetical protein
LAASPRTGSAQQTAAGSPIFVFKTDGFWLNLHSFLYVLGRDRLGVPDRTRETVAGAPADQEQGLTKASEGDDQIWRDAVTSYAGSLSKLDAVFDAGMIDVTAALSRLDDQAPLPTTLPSDVRATLERAAPIYRARWWPAHRASNQAWLASIQALLDRHGQAILKFITNAFGTTWPSAGFPVNVAAYSNWAGAYSTRGNLLVVASHKSQRGALGFEAVFHEAMHQWDNQMYAALSKEAQRLGRRVPPDLSHALVFYTAGEAVRGVIPGHVPLGEAVGVWNRGLKPFRTAVVEVWKPYLDGRGSREEALAELIRRTSLISPGLKTRPPWNFELPTGSALSPSTLQTS